MEKRRVNRPFKRARQSADEFVFGTRAVMEAIHAGKEIERLFIQRDIQNDLIRELKLLLSQRGIPFQPVPAEKLQRMTQKNHQGVIAIVSPITYVPLANLVQQIFEQGELPLFILLDRITDVRNLGAIARTAECLGAHGLVVPAKGSAQINSDAVKTSAGALHHLPVCREASLKKTISYLQNSGISVVACTEKAADDLYDAQLDGPVALLMGSEEDGIDPELLRVTEKMVKVPMEGNVSSLNVSVATAMCLYEVVRQRKKA